MKKIVICIDFGAQIREFRVEEEFDKKQFAEFVARSFPDFRVEKFGMRASNKDGSSMVVVEEDGNIFSNIDDVTAFVFCREIRIRKTGESIWNSPGICAPIFKEEN